jgi:hypothetical protein
MANEKLNYQLPLNYSDLANSKDDPEGSWKHRFSLLHYCGFVNVVYGYFVN